MGSPWFQIYQRNLQRILFANFIDALEDDRRRRGNLRTASDLSDNALERRSSESWPATCSTTDIAQGAQ